MNILVSGCSFTQWPESPGRPNSCWPRYLGHNVTNVGEPAAGNQYIADSVIRAVNTNRPDMVIVMWTGVSRLDYLTSLEDSAWEQLFDSYGFYRRIPGNKLGYIFSGGQMGTWFKNPVAHKMFYEMYKVSSELSLATLNLQEIIKTQHFLKSKNIPYKFMSYVNYWNNKKDLSPNGDFGIMGMPELDYLINDIDFTPWIFSDADRNGIYELAKSNKDFQPDGFHPGDNTHRAWADFIISRI